MGKTLNEWAQEFWQNAEDHGFHDALNLPAPDRTPERAVAEVRRLVGQDWGGDLRGLAAREAQ